MAGNPLNSFEIPSGTMAVAEHDSRAYFKTSHKNMDILLNHGTFGSEVFKSPFEKGGFRGISGIYINPPIPPFSKGGN